VTSQVEILYYSKINDIQNQLLISPFIRAEGIAKPLIPGSSIKGAIRTAVISEFAKTSNLSKPKDYKEEYTFESKVLGYKDAKNDPFRGIKIRDTTLQNDSTIIRNVRNVSRKNGGKLQSNNIQIFCEVSHSSITGKSIYFEIEIIFDKELFSTHFLSKILTKEGIAKSCSEFYRDKMEYEHKKFYQNSEVELCSTQLLNTKFDNESFLLRIGRYSGVESVTLDNYRNPKPPGNKTVWGTTRNLAEGIYPMGWIKVRII
jgi:CRISPR-associated protein Csm5